MNQQETNERCAMMAMEIGVVDEAKFKFLEMVLVLMVSATTNHS